MSTPPPAQSTLPEHGKPATRQEYIDGLRAFAMLWVLLFHCWMFGYYWNFSLPIGHHAIDFGLPLHVGYAGVNLFLVLSGFCLYWPIAKSRGAKEPGLLSYAKRRCRRILPPYYATLAIFGGLAFFFNISLEHHDSVFVGKWLIWHLLMLQNMRGQYMMSIDAPLWSLALEFQLYILFPLLVVGYRRFNCRAVLLAVLIATTFFRVFAYKYGYSEIELLTVSVFARAFEFALGMFLAKAVAEREIEGGFRLTRLDYAAGALLFAVAFATNWHSHWAQKTGRPLEDVMWGLAAGGFILLGSQRSSLAHRWLSAKWFSGLGIFSYSVYLIHQPLVIGLNKLAENLNLTGVKLGLLDFVVVAPIAIGLGYLFHLVFEKPFMQPARLRTKEEPAVNGEPLPEIHFAPAPLPEAQQALARE